MRQVAWVPAVLFLTFVSLQAAPPQWGADPSMPQGAFGRPAQKAAPTQQAPQSPAAVKPPAAALASGPIAEPTWPQRFAVSRGERAGFGFVVGQPGRIAVTVQSQGAPLVVSLVKPGGTTVDKQGTGSITIETSASADDVKHGVIWVVSVRAAQPQNAASGSVSVQHPAADFARAKAELEAVASRAKAMRESAPKAAAGLDFAAQRQLALDKETAARQTARLDQLKGRISPEAYQRMSMHIAARAQGRAVGMAPAAALAGGAAKASPFAATAVRATNSASQGDTGTGASPVGSNQPVSVATSTISSVEGVEGKPEGKPGDPILISGTGFSNTPGEVHFIVADRMDLKVDGIPPAQWNDTQILTAVPEVDGIPAFNGQMYVQRGSQRSKLVPFHFVPTMVTRTLDMTSDRKITEPGGAGAGGILHNYVSMVLALVGGSGDDEFFLSKRLINGWHMYRAYLVGPGGSDAPGIQNWADASVVESDLRPGTDSPYVKVHWWFNPSSAVVYQPKVVIEGPKGMPHE